MARLFLNSRHSAFVYNHVQASRLLCCFIIIIIMRLKHTRLWDFPSLPDPAEYPYPPVTMQSVNKYAIRGERWKSSIQPFHRVTLISSTGM